VVGEEIGGFHGDIYGRPAEACKWAKGSNNGVDGVTADVGEGRFGMIAAAEKVAWPLSSEWDVWTNARRLRWLRLTVR
jgi:hypothetical protein